MICRHKASEQIFEELMRMIRFGHYVQGDRLPSENRLAEMFGVSRSPVREALSVLTASGIIESKQGGGSYVKAAIEAPVLQKIIEKAVDFKDILHLLEMRQMLEPEAAYLAAQRRTEEDLANIEQALVGFGTVTEDGQAIGEEEDFALHRALVVAAHNPILLDIVDYVSKHYRRSLALTLAQNIGLWQKRQQVYNEHMAICAAVRDRQADLAKVQSQVHLDKVRQKVTGFLGVIERNTQSS
ncbi:MAG TPA: FadR/GntR family transcriptional regulator [Spirochaetia bacterium]|nr:FadR/GntR family transcriptional regulator [Spirochaetia bacterium]